MTSPPSPKDITELPKVVDVPDQPCQQLYEANPVLLGFDVVQYHFIPSIKDGGIPVRGLSKYAYNFEGYQFWFSTEENRDAFIENPWKYAPAWGGFCSWGIAKEVKPQWPWDVNYLGPPASPWNGWAIIDDVLIFNIWESYTDLFRKDEETNMALAAKRWKEMFGNGTTVHAGPFNTHCIGHGPLKNWCLSQQPSPWLKELPKCNADGTGGGIVGINDDFDDFSNQSISPYHKRWFISGVVIIPLICLLCIGCFIRCCCRRHNQRRNGDATVKDIVDDDNDNENSADSGTEEEDGDDNDVPSKQEEEVGMSPNKELV